MWRNSAELSASEGTGHNEGHTYEAAVGRENGMEHRGFLFSLALLKIFFYLKACCELLFN